MKFFFDKGRQSHSRGYKTSQLRLKIQLHINLKISPERGVTTLHKSILFLLKFSKTNVYIRGFVIPPQNLQKLNQTSYRT